MMIASCHHMLHEKDVIKQSNSSLPVRSKHLQWLTNLFVHVGTSQCQSTWNLMWLGVEIEALQMGTSLICIVDVCVFVWRVILFCIIALSLLYLFVGCHESLYIFEDHPKIMTGTKWKQWRIQGVKG